MQQLHIIQSVDTLLISFFFLIERYVVNIMCELLGKYLFRFLMLKFIGCIVYQNLTRVSGRAHANMFEE